MLFEKTFFGLEGVIGKYVGCFLVYLFFFWGGEGVIKNGGMFNNYKKCIVTSFLCVFMAEKGISELGVLGSCKIHYFRATQKLQKQLKMWLLIKLLKNYKAFTNEYLNKIYIKKIDVQKTIFPKFCNIIKSSKRQSKYHFSINFLAEKRPHFPSPKSSNEKLFSNHLFIPLLAQTISYFPFSKSSKQEIFSNL